jgi:hypothetical protein
VEARYHGLGDISHDVARLAAGEALQHLNDDPSDRRLVRGDPPRCEPGLEEHLEAIVAR